jgi:hypothetical protein
MDVRPGPLRWGLCPMVSPQGEPCRFAMDHKGPHDAPPYGLSGSSTMMRIYHGSPQESAQLMQAEARQLAASGYYLTSQSWAEGHWLVKPTGTLTVTYGLRQPQPAAATGGSNPTLSSRLGELDAAKAAGLITSDEWAAKRARILDEM